MTKQGIIDAAEIFDTWRVVPRVILFGYCFWIMHVIDMLLVWYQRLPAAERSTEATFLSGGVISVITGLFPLVYKIYSDAGRDWTVMPAPVLTSTTTSSTTLTK